MVEESTCQWEKCTLPQEDTLNPWCILHDPDENKNSSTLNEDLGQKIRRFNQTLEDKI